MKALLAFVALVAISSTTIADLVAPLTAGVECITVGADADDQGKPDLKQFNQNLNRRAGVSEADLASVSVTPVGDEFLVCTTAKAVKAAK
jgi:hypothetical protein